MSELASVQPAKPGSGDRAYSGLHGVWYTDRKAEPDTKPLEVFFAVTMRVVIAPNGEVVDPAIVAGYAEAMMQQFIDWHKEGIAILDPLSIRPDPADQRPPAEQTSRKSYENTQSAPPQSNDPAGNQPTVKTFECVKIEKERENGKTWLRFFMKNGKYPAVRVHTDEKVWSKACNQLQPLTNIDWANADLGTSINCNLVCGYTESGQKKSGNPYWNFYGIRAK